MTSPVARDTSPTWELELLISGAVLFALFQLPGALDTVFDRLEPHATRAIQPAVFIVRLYFKAIVYALVVTFVLHLVARAYWVGLVGLNSVYPAGIRWEKLNMGPIAIEVQRERMASLPKVIARADNFCSVIFSFAFLLVIMFLFTIVLSGVFGGLAFGTGQLFGGRYVRQIFFGLLLVFAAVPLATQFVDRRLGARLPPGSRAARTVRALSKTAYHLSLISVMGPILLTLMSNEGRVRILAIFYSAVFALIVLVAADRLAHSDRLSVNSYDFAGSSEAHGVNFRYYESLRRKGDIHPRLPSIQSDVVREPFVRLFIPYAPDRHNAAIAARCPAVRPVQERGVQLGAEPPVPDSLALPALACLADLHQVTMNGARIASDGFSFYEHPESGLKGIIAYIPTDALPRGRNVISVQPAPRPAASRPQRPYIIPFWR